MTRIFRHGTLRGKVAQAAPELVRQPQRHLIASTDSDAAFARLSGPRAHFPACAAEPVRVKSAPGPPGCLALWGNKSGNVLALLVLVRDTASTHAKGFIRLLAKSRVGSAAILFLGSGLGRRSRRSATYRHSTRRFGWIQQMQLDVADR